MQFTCTQEDLTSALKHVTPAVPGKSNLPILQHVMLRVSGERLTLHATDLEIALSFSLDIADGQDGAITLPGKMLQTLMAKMPEGHVTVTTDNEKHHGAISGGAAEFTLYGLPAEEFPTVPTLPEERTFFLPGQTLREMITRVRFAAIADESRIILQGACFTWADGTATLVATDTHRLAVDSRPIAGEGEALTCIIPALALDEMARAIGKSEKTVSLHISASQVGLTVEGLLLVSRLIEGQFPDYDRSMRAESPTTITVHPGCLLHAIDRQGVIARAESSKIFLKSGENYIELSAQTGEGGKGRENLPASLTGPSVEAAFNADYLHDVLSVLDTEAVMLGFDGSLRPIMIHGQGIDGYACVVMPMQIL